MADVSAAEPQTKVVPFYTRVTLVGLLVYTAVYVTIGAISLAGGDTFFPIYALAVGVLTLIIAWLSRRFGPWALVVAAVWGLLNLVSNGPFVLPALAEVNSFFDFGISLPVLVTLIVATLAAPVAFVQQRRGATRTAATGGERVLFGGIAVAVVSLMLLSGVLHLTGRNTVSAGDKAGAIEVEMKSIEFKPDDLQIVAGRTTTFAVRNRDFGVHTFTRSHVHTFTRSHVHTFTRSRSKG